MNETYTIHLPAFEGPFDLLLFFIERDELDIYDIPIAKITEDFLAYLRQMEALNIDLASEFILVAATLMRIKARMLLPRKAVDEAGNEIDPREELVQKLLEYRQYKSIVDDMRQLEERRALQTPRGYIAEELQQIATKALVDAELESVSLFKLLRAFENIMSRIDQQRQKGAIHTVYNYEYTIQDQQDLIAARIRQQPRTGFADLFGTCENRIHAIVTFLALLELLNARLADIIQGEGVNNFWVVPAAPEAA